MDTDDEMVGPGLGKEDDESYRVQRERIKTKRSGELAENARYTGVYKEIGRVR